MLDPADAQWNQATTLALREGNANRVQGDPCVSVSRSASGFICWTQLSNQRTLPRPLTRFNAHAESLFPSSYLSFNHSTSPTSDLRFVVIPRLLFFVPIFLVFYQFLDPARRKKFSSVCLPISNNELLQQGCRFQRPFIVPFSLDMGAMDRQPQKSLNL